jgi:acetyl-CoA carboxylase biotin carboxyl carrier protein
MSPVSWGPALRSIISKVEASDVRELEVRAGGLRIKLRRELRPLATATLPLVEDVGEASGLHAIRSPLTGIWYDSPAPGAPPFVNVGTSVDIGSIVGLVETMKVFNEVVSDEAGIVRHIYVRRGELVTEQSALLAIESVEDDTTLPAGQLQ